MSVGINKRNNVYLLYTLSFLVLLPIVFLPFITSGKSFVWITDGINQHYPMFLYYGKLLRSVLSGNGFPMVDYSLGLGFDSITTLHYYVLGDPISLLSIFSSPQNGVYLYSVLVLVRLYLMGISFVYFMKYWKKDGFGVLLGALIYVFCGYSFYAGVRHPFFLNPMIFLPLLLIGLEKVMRREKPYLLIAVVFISTLSNFYFAYILVVISVIYVIFRYFSIYNKDNKRVVSGLFITGFKTGGFYLLGMAMAGVILVPVIYAFFQNGRLDTTPQMLFGYFHYDMDYYITTFQGILAAGVSPWYWVKLSFSSIAVVSMAILLSDKKYRQLQIVVLLSFLALCVPAFGFLMNGFSYVTNRWCFLLSLVVAVVFTVTYEKIFELKKKQMLLLGIAVIIYGILAFAYPSKDIVKYEFVILIATIIIVLSLQGSYFQRRRVLQKSIIYAFVLFTLGFHGYAYYSPQFKGYVNQFLDKEQVLNKTTKGSLDLISNIDDNSFYRIETFGDGVVNEALCIGVNDVSGYFSLLDGNITTGFKQLELLSQKNAYRFENLDNRTILNTLGNGKYFITNNKSTAPYGYHLLKEMQNNEYTYYLFENKYSLPLGFAYDSYILEEDYKKLSPLEKQNAMLYSVILEKKCESIDQVNQDIRDGIKNLDVNIKPDENIILDSDKIKVKKAGATITLEFESVPNTETYIRLANLKIKKRAATMSSLNIIDNVGIVKNVNLRSEFYNSYFGKENYLVNMGYSAEGKSWVKIMFNKKGTFTFNSIGVYALDMSGYEKQIQKLKETTLQDIKISNNKIRGNITLKKNSILNFSIPYSKGWNAYVDGEKVNIRRGNIMYMALPLATGEHDIVLKYQTPFLFEGLLVSSIALFILICIVLYNKLLIKRDNSPDEKSINNLEQ